MPSELTQTQVYLQSQKPVVIDPGPHCMFRPIVYNTWALALIPGADIATMTRAGEIIGLTLDRSVWVSLIRPKTVLQAACSLDRNQCIKAGSQARPGRFRRAVAHNSAPPSSSRPTRKPRRRESTTR